MSSLSARKHAHSRFSLAAVIQGRHRPLKSQFWFSVPLAASFLAQATESWGGSSSRRRQERMHRRRREGVMENGIILDSHLFVFPPASEPDTRDFLRSTSTTTVSGEKEAWHPLRIVRSSTGTTVALLESPPCSSRNTKGPASVPSSRRQASLTRLVSTHPAHCRIFSCRPIGRSSVPTSLTRIWSPCETQSLRLIYTTPGYTKPPSVERPIIVDADLSQPRTKAW